MVRITQEELEKEKPFLCAKCGKRYAEENYLRTHQKLSDCVQRRENQEKARARLALKKIEVEKILALQPEGRLVSCPSCEKLFAKTPYLMCHISGERCLGKGHSGSEGGELEEGEIKTEEVKDEELEDGGGKDDEGTETKIKREVIEKDETKPAAMIKSENDKVERSPKGKGKGKGKERAELKVKMEAETAVKVKVEEGVEHRSKDGKAAETPKLKMDSSFNVYKDGHFDVKVKVRTEKSLTEASPNSFPASPKYRKPKDKDEGRAHLSDTAL